MLTDDEIQQSIEAGERVYREHRGNVRGMTVQPIDDVTYCIARAVERAVVEKLAQPSAEPTLVRAARNALAAWPDMCVATGWVRPMDDAIDALRGALEAGDGAGVARDAGVTDAMVAAAERELWMGGMRDVPDSVVRRALIAAMGDAPEAKGGGR